MTAAVLAILMATPFTTFVDCSDVVGYDEKKKAYLMECTLAVAGKVKVDTKLIPIYCIMDFKGGAFMCKFNLKSKSSSDSVPRDRTGWLPQLLNSVCCRYLHNIVHLVRIEQEVLAVVDALDAMILSIFFGYD